MNDELYAGNAVIGKGQCASGGAVAGELVFTIEEALECQSQHISCILVLHHADVDDILGLEVRS